MSQFSLVKSHFWVGLAFICLGSGVSTADVVNGFNSITVDNTDAANVFISELVFDGTTYTPDQFVYGVTTRFYNTTAGGTAVWNDGDPVPADIEVVPDSSTPKVGDIGSRADDNVFLGPGNHMSSIDGLPFQRTIFATPVDTIFVFERGGNDMGTISPILLDDTLGTPLDLIANGAPYSDTLIPVGNQNAFGYVYIATLPIKGIQITAPGHDALSIFTAVPEPGSFALLALGGLLVSSRRKR